MLTRLASLVTSLSSTQMTRSIKDITLSILSPGLLETLQVTISILTAITMAQVGSVR